LPAPFHQPLRIPILLLIRRTGYTENFKTCFKTDGLSHDKDSETLTKCDFFGKRRKKSGRDPNEHPGFAGQRSPIVDQRSASVGPHFIDVSEQRAVACQHRRESSEHFHFAAHVCVLPDDNSLVPTNNRILLIDSQPLLTNNRGLPVNMRRLFAGKRQLPVNIREKLTNNSSLPACFSGMLTGKA
jgi:hypothetical protein